MISELPAFAGNRCFMGLQEGYLWGQKAVRNLHVMYMK